VSDLIAHLTDAPLPNLLIVAGLIFVGIGVVGKVSGKIEPDTTGRVMAGLFGIALIAGGMFIHSSADAKTGSRVPLANRRDAAGAEGKNIFRSPTIGGYRLDFCLTFGNDCGKPAADEFCKRQKFEESVLFENETVGTRGIQTKVIGTGQICDMRDCSAFTLIRCR
jgi:hypothetical protein